MKKRLIITIICTILTLGTYAKTMSEIWACMPDSVIPYLDRAHRTQMIEYIKMGLKGNVDHSLAGESAMNTLTNDYIYLTLNESVVMEVKKLPHCGADSLLCVVTTWKGPAEESSVQFFTQDWQALDLPQAFEGKKLTDLADELMQKPDTMDDKQFAELRSMIDPIMIGAHLSPANDRLRLHVSLPLLSADDQKAVEAIARELVLSWDGNAFQRKE